MKGPGNIRPGQLPSNFSTGTQGTTDRGDTTDLIDTRATYSVLNAKLASFSKDSATVAEVTGQPQMRPLLQPLECQLGEQKSRHNFLHKPYCPIPLLGQDLLCKLKAQIMSLPEEQTALSTGPS